MSRRTAMLLAPGVVAFLIAALSVADMFLPRPYDGVILEPDIPDALVVRIAAGITIRPPLLSFVTFSINGLFIYL